MCKTKGNEMKMQAVYHDEFIRYEYSADGLYDDHKATWVYLDTVQVEKIVFGDQVFERPFAAGSMQSIAAELALDLLDDVEFEEDV
jgi:hypothetical protein